MDKIYYVEKASTGNFAIVDEQEVLDLLKVHEGYKELYIRPMHEEENWDKTIAHEQGGGKRYFVLTDEEDVEEFMEG